jgi:hypothetical protein
VRPMTRCSGGRMRRQATPFKTRPGSSWRRRCAWWVARSGPSDVGSLGQVLGSGPSALSPFLRQQRVSATTVRAEPGTAAAGTAGRPEGAAAEGRCLNLSLGQFRSTEREANGGTMSNCYHSRDGDCNDDGAAPWAAQAGSGDLGGCAGDLPQRPDGGRPAGLPRSPSHARVRAAVGSICWRPLAAVTRTWRSGNGTPGASGSAEGLQAPEESVGPMPLRRSGSADRSPDQVQALPWSGLWFRVGRWRVRVRRLAWAWDDL